MGDAVELTAVETKLVCGNPESEAWRRVPPHQARYFLRAFLQQRGYHSPSFSADDAGLVVRLGTRTHTESLTAHGLPTTIDPSKLRGTVEGPLTPQRLDAIKGELLKALQERGHGCPEIALAADPATGVVDAKVAPGPVHRVEVIEPPQIEGIDPRVFRRYEAFRRGAPLDLRLLNLSAERVVAEDLFISAYYELRCSTAGLNIVLKVIPAPPRLVTAGVGVDTEGLARGRVRWRHARIGRAAGSAEASLFASFREQSLVGLLRVYPDAGSRAHLVPRAELRREHELRYESRSAQIELKPATTYDDQTARLKITAGPSFEYSDTPRGQGPVREHFLAFEGRVEWVSHLFEFYGREPRRGWMIALDDWSRGSGLHSELTAHRVRLEAQSLWNLGNYDPPLAVLGWSGWLGSTLVSDEPRAFLELPPARRFFLGGEADLRGAARKEIPADGAGFLTAAYQGLELRSGDILWRNIQPLAFVDAAMGGRRKARLEPEIYWSPGVGLRWPSPVGAVRATAARGFVSRRRETTPHRPHWQFFVSLGREF